MSHGMCPVLGVGCHMSHVTCWVSIITFFLVKFVNLVSGGSFENRATPSSLSRPTCLTGANLGRNQLPISMGEGEGLEIWTRANLELQRFHITPRKII